MVTSTLDPLRQLNALIKPLRENELVSISKQELCGLRDEIGRLKKFEPLALPFPMSEFRGTRQKILSRVHQAGAAGVKREVLIQHLWGNDRNGGPENASNTLSVHISLANRRLAKNNLRIKNTQLGRYADGVYVLEELK